MNRIIKFYVNIERLKKYKKQISKKRKISMHIFQHKSYLIYSATVSILFSIIFLQFPECMWFIITNTQQSLDSKTRHYSQYSSKRIKIESVVYTEWNCFIVRNISCAFSFKHFLHIHDFDMLLYINFRKNKKKMFIMLSIYGIIFRNLCLMHDFLTYSFKNKYNFLVIKI